ncbi:hypothetical protein EX30DRAFT_375550 [Ascodesmis nigricans]|uniref:Uncharacterized protein n=1 Tax=Ascodesmis nigricans TaxID=341454 RepID=A0A4S2MHV2_9PEZI|nr:hypothetical protein EX30DRAFT_375550 [Ascodesmis nigricans]
MSATERSERTDKVVNNFVSTPSRGPVSIPRPPPPHPRGPSGGPPYQPRGAPPLPPSVSATRPPPPHISSSRTPSIPPSGPRRPPIPPVTPTTTATSPAIPTGPRAGNFPYRSSLPAPPRYPSSITGPGALIPGGRLLPSFDKTIDERLARLKADQAKLEEDLKGLQEKKRSGLLAWERSKREAEKEAFKVESAEGQLNRDTKMEDVL